MKLKEFTKRILDHHRSAGGVFCAVYEPGADHGPPTSWALYARYAELTKYIRYGCDFVKGVCRGASVRAPQWGRGKMCCCKDCGERIGHHFYFPADDDLRRKIGRYYTRSTGFWRSGRGCILPRRYRSEICLTYTCPDVEGKEITGGEPVRAFHTLCAILTGGVYKDAPTPERLKQMILEELAQSPRPPA